MNATIACFSTGTLGPLYFNLSLRVRFFPGFPRLLKVDPFLLRRTLPSLFSLPTSSPAAFPPLSLFSAPDSE